MERDVTYKQKRGDFIKDMHIFIIVKGLEYYRDRGFPTNLFNVTKNLTFLNLLVLQRENLRCSTKILEGIKTTVENSIPALIENNYEIVISIIK